MELINSAAAAVNLERFEAQLQDATGSDDQLLIIENIEGAELALMEAFAKDTADINRPDVFPFRPDNHLLRFMKRMVTEL